MIKSNSKNIQALWGELIVEELIRCGVSYFCVCPGSRSTPLTLAVANNKNAKHLIHFDERTNAYQALGYASARRGGVAIITTSGTAVANLYPAVIEASKKKLPLIVLTADRPNELRQTGAHQTIDQVSLFGNYSRFNADLPVPDEKMPLSYVLTTIDQAVYRSHGELPGPVHLNCMFREPFFQTKKDSIAKNLISSIKAWNHSDQPYTTYMTGQKTFKDSALNGYVQKLEGIKSGVIVVGKLKDQASAKAVSKLGKRLQWPIFPDLTSGLRLGVDSEEVIPHFRQLLSAQNPKFDGVLHLGGRITAKNWYEWVEKINPSVYMMVLNHPLRNDPLHNVTHRVEGDVGSFCQSIVKRVSARKSSTILKKLQADNDIVCQEIEQEFNIIEDVSEPAVCYAISQSIPASHALFVSNSLPIREFEAFADSHSANVEIGANRGASGIDGTIATAVGFGRGLDKRVTLLIGDLACLYDLNALSLLKDLKRPVTAIVFNNDGGGIFSFLPVAKQEPQFEQFFGTPHGLEFSGAAKMFGLKYAQPRTMSEFREVYRSFLNNKGSGIIEIQTNRRENFEYQQHLCRQIQAKTA